MASIQFPRSREHAHDLLSRFAVFACGRWPIRGAKQRIDNPALLQSKYCVPTLAACRGRLFAGHGERLGGRRSRTPLAAAIRHSSGHVKACSGDRNCAVLEAVSKGCLMSIGMIALRIVAL